MDHQQEDIGAHEPGGIQQYPAHYGPGHLADIVADHVQGKGVNQSALSDDVEDGGPAGWVLDGFGQSLDEHRPKHVPWLDQIKVVGDHRQQGGCRQDVYDLTCNQYPAPWKPVGDVTGEHGDHGPGKVVEGQDQAQLEV